MTNIQSVVTDPETAARQPYVKPAIVHELRLETRAGSLPGIPPLDPLHLDPNKPKVQ